MDIEPIFAARVLDASRRARIAKRSGLFQSEADQIEIDLSDLHACGGGLGYGRAELRAIENYWVERVDGVVRPRAAGNVTRLPCD